MDKDILRILQESEKDKRKEEREVWEFLEYIRGIISTIQQTNNEIMLR